MTFMTSRRALVSAALALPLLALPACAVGINGLGFEEAVRRVLAISSKRAFARLLRENGFFGDELARISLPPELGGAGASSALAALLRTEAVQMRLLRQVNKAAEVAAQAAVPVVRDATRELNIPDAFAIARAGGTAATDLLQRSMGNAIFEAMVPGVGTALQAFDNAVVEQALSAATGINLEGLRLDIARRASESIYRAIGREEAAIRANPSLADDAIVSSIFGGLPR